MKMFSENCGSVCDISEIKQTELSSLYHFDHMLCSVVRDGNRVSLFQYNLVSGKSNVSTIESVICDKKCKDKPITYSNNNKLFVVKKVKKENSEC